MKKAFSLTNILRFGGAIAGLIGLFLIDFNNKSAQGWFAATLMLVGIVGLIWGHFRRKSEGEIPQKTRLHHGVQAGVLFIVGLGLMFASKDADSNLAFWLLLVGGATIVIKAGYHFIVVTDWRPNPQTS